MTNREWTVLVIGLVLGWAIFIGLDMAFTEQACGSGFRPPCPPVHRNLFDFWFHFG